MEVEVFDDNLSQRYILALLAFSFDSLAWKNCGNYTSSLSDEVDKEDTADSCFVKDINNMTEEYHVWLSATDECEWYGVTCFDGLVRWVELPDIDLIGEIPPELGKLRFLQILDFSGNCLYGTIPSEIGTLSNLQQLELSQNGLSGFVPDELFEASSLLKLDLGYQFWNDWNCTRSNGDVVSIRHSKGDPENDINYGLEGEILGNQTGKLKYLKEIAVNDNYFSGEIASEIGELKQLVKLNAGTNSFWGFIPDNITKLEKLQELWLEQNYITGELPQDIGNMKSLDSLSVWGNENMTGIIPDSLYNLTKLKFLFLQGNAFSGTISQEIGNLKRLQQLTLSNNDFSGTLPTELGLCEELDWLRIEGTDIEGSVPEEVCLLRNKKLNSDDEFMEFFAADCLKDNETMEPFYECHCCYSCCDHTTAQCQIVGK